MKWYVNFLLLFGMPGLADIPQPLLAAEVTYGPGTYGPGSNAPISYPGSMSLAASNVTIVALNAQAALLKELAQEHQMRAADSARSNQTEKVKWETELANELQNRNARLAKAIEELTGQQSAVLGTNNASLKSVEGDEEAVFLARVEERLLQINQDLMATLDQARTFGLQLATNKSPENLQWMSFMVEDNQRYVRQLQKEQFDLELRKLEFRALRKSIGK
jgi:hypothetical protein